MAKNEKSTVKKQEEKPKKASEGSTVKIDYVGSFDDGKVFDSSIKHGQPIEFVVGSGQVIPGFDKAVRGMGVGEEKVVKIEAKDAYGERKDELVKIITRDKLPKEKEPVVGMMIVLGMANGVEIPAIITKVNGDMVTIDLNHPLAGKNLTFKLKLIEFN
jgi:FKBP-type peptidyl-prolyl cis-trans isomerase 2